MMKLSDVVISIFIIAAVTFFTRAFPFLFYRGRKPPKMLLFIEKYIPPMVMTILVLYCLKDINWPKTPYGLPELISVALTASLHVWKRNPLISIFGGTIFYMVLVQSEILTKIIHFMF